MLVIGIGKRSNTESVCLRSIKKNARRISAGRCQEIGDETKKLFVFFVLIVVFLVFVFIFFFGLVFVLAFVFILILVSILVGILIFIRLQRGSCR